MSEMLLDAINATAASANSTSASFTISPVVATSLVAVIALIWITAFVLNLLLCIVFTKNTHLRTNFNLYLFNMAMADLLFVLLSMTNFILYISLGYYPFGFNGCHFWLYFDWIFSSVTENTVMLISVDRLYSLYWPIEYRNLQSTKYSKVALCCMWIWINLLILPPLILSRWSGTEGVDGVCDMDYESVQGWILAVTVVLAFWLPEAITVLAYIFIALKARKVFYRNHSADNAHVVSGSKYALLFCLTMNRMIQLKQLANSIDGNKRLASDRGMGCCIATVR